MQEWKQKVTKVVCIVTKWRKNHQTHPVTLKRVKTKTINTASEDIQITMMHYGTSVWHRVVVTTLPIQMSEYSLHVQCRIF